MPIGLNSNSMIRFSAFLCRVFPILNAHWFLFLEDVGCKINEWRQYYNEDFPYIALPRATPNPPVPRENSLLRQGYQTRVFHLGIILTLNLSR